VNLLDGFKYVYKPRNINVLLRKTDHNGMAACLNKKHFEGSKKCCMSNAVDETDNNMLWNEREEVGNVSACEEDEDTDCEGEESDIVL